METSIPPESVRILLHLVDSSKGYFYHPNNITTMDFHSPAITHEKPCVFFVSKPIFEQNIIYVYNVPVKAKNVYPDWVEKYREKGKTIRKVRDGYGLYKCSSVYVKGSKYPKLKQEYLGMITEKDGFIPKKVIPLHPNYREYGLSHFILINFKRNIRRSAYQSNDSFVILVIIQYMFGSIDPVFIRSTWISHGIEDELIEYSSKISATRIINVSKKIDKLLLSSIPDEKNRNMVVKLLFLTVIETTNGEPIPFSQEVVDILKRYGLKYE